MCQIIAGPSAKVKEILLGTPGILEELFENNGDGWGAMYHTKAGTKAIKKLPLTAECTREYIQALPQDDRQVALHWRMRTSGDIDTHNAHPHFVEGGWLIHNGILGGVDMSSDRSLCDTIHFSRQYLDGNVGAIVQSKSLQTLIGEFIGNNRFVLLSDDGQMCIINKHQGYEVGGIWVANTYASSRHLIDPTYKPRTAYGDYGRWRGHNGSFDTWGSMDKGWRDDPNDELYTAVGDVEEVVEECLYQFDSITLAELLEEFPDETLAYLVASYRITRYERYDPTEYPHSYAEAVEAWINGEVGRLSRMDPTVVADALIQCCDADARQPAHT